MTRMHLIARAGAVLLLASCGAPTEDSTSPATPPAPPPAAPGLFTFDLANPPNYANPAYPVHYDVLVRGADNTPAGNPVTDRGATLGRVLFYDKQLSLNNTVSCASCHVQTKGITDDRTLSVGFQGGLTGSHAMRLANVRFYTGVRMFWNRRAVDVEDQSLQPVQDATEMGFTPAVGGVAAMIARLQSLSYYPTLFEWAFGSPTITEDRLRRALAQYVRSIVSIDSRFDRALAAAFVPGQPNGGSLADFAGFTAQENLGKRLYIQAPPQGAGCAVCHTIPTFALTANSLSNGLDAGETAIFKSPSLKNVAVAGPYMHDGRLATLEAVIDHYDHGVQAGPALDQRLRGPGGVPLRLNLTAVEKAALVAFLRTLTDDTLLADRRFSNPFR